MFAENNNNKMSFRLDKCAVSMFNKGSLNQMENIVFEDKEVNESL